MSNRQFHRICRVTAYRANPNPSSSRTVVADALEITDLAMKFEIEKSLGKDPNTCTVKIYNANPANRDFLAQLPLVVRLEAGYDDEYRHMFAGDLIRSFSSWKETEWETTLQIGDGSRTIRFSRVDRSYKAGTTVLTSLRDVAASMGLVLPDNIEISPELQRQFAAGISLSGPSRYELTRLLAPFGYHWSIQNGKMVVLKDNEQLFDEAILVDKNNWLLGTPEYGTPDKTGKPPVLKFDTQLYPEIEPGKRVAIESTTASGTFKVQKLKHSGDTEEGDWKTSSEGIAA